MAKILVTGYYNPGLIKAFVEIYSSPDKPKYPDYIKKVENLVTGTGDFKVYAIYEVPNDKIYEALTHINKRYVYYAARVKGYEYNIELVGSVEEAIASLM
ncbi:MAG: hypothetical protein ACTSRE_14400 [Promethearchaeota archaeon]